MLTLANVTSAQAKTYYRRDNYTPRSMLKQEGTGSRWLGDGCKILALEGDVRPADFESLLQGMSQNGERLGRNSEVKSKYAATDQCFEAPKSVSMVGLWKGDDRVVTAHQQAVNAVLRVTEEIAAHAELRVGSGRLGLITIPTNNLAIGAFTHTVSRKKDPHLHDHAVTFNFTHTENGWRRLNNRAIYQTCRLRGDLYSSYLASNLQTIGYELEAKGSNFWEIKGYSEFQLEWFSKRRQEILEKCGANSSRSERDKAWELTRIPKGECESLSELVAQWDAENKAFDLEIVHPEALGVSQYLNPQSPEEALSEAIDRLSQQRFSFHRREIEAEVYSQPQRFDYETLQNEIDASANLIDLGDSLYSSESNLEREMQVVSLVQEGVDVCQPIAEAQEVEALSQNLELDEASRQAMARALQSHSRFVAWKVRRDAVDKAKALELAQVARDMAAAKGITLEIVESDCSAVELMEILESAQPRNARVLFIDGVAWDRKIHAFESVKSAGIELYNFSDGQEDLKASAKQGADRVRQGKVREALIPLDRANQIVEVPDAQARAAEIAIRYLNLPQELKSKVAIVVTSEADRQEILNALQLAKVENGNGQINCLSPRGGADTAQVGDLLKSNQVYRGLGLARRESYRVLEVDGSSLTLQTIGKDDAVKVVPKSINAIVYKSSVEALQVGDRLEFTEPDPRSHRAGGGEFIVHAVSANHAQIQFLSGKYAELDLDQAYHVQHGLVYLSHEENLEGKELVWVASSQIEFIEELAPRLGAMREITLFTEDKSALLGEAILPIKDQWQLQRLIEFEAQTLEPPLPKPIAVALVEPLVAPLALPSLDPTPSEPEVAPLAEPEESGFWIDWQEEFAQRLRQSLYGERDPGYRAPREGSRVQQNSNQGMTVGGGDPLQNETNNLDWQVAAGAEIESIALRLILEEYAAGRRHDYIERDGYSITLSEEYLSVVDVGESRDVLGAVRGGEMEDYTQSEDLERWRMIGRSLRNIEEIRAEIQQQKSKFVKDFKQDIER